MEIYSLWLVRVGECLGVVDGGWGWQFTGSFQGSYLCVQASQLPRGTYSPLVEDLHRLQVSCQGIICVCGELVFGGGRLVYPLIRDRDGGIGLLQIVFVDRLFPVGKWWE